MTETSGRFALPFIQAGQAQKEFFHNEALALIDAALHPVALTIGDNDPPSAPLNGQCWIVGAAPTGGWAGQAHALAAWTAGGWRFITPRRGMTVWLASTQVWAWHDGDAWLEGVMPAAAIRIGGQQVVGAREAAIAAPSAGTTIDGEARAAIAAILAALQNHGLIAT